MQNFSIAEIEAKIEYHKRQSDTFEELVNEPEIFYAGFFVGCAKRIRIGVVGSEPGPVNNLRSFFFEMSEYHRIELVKWEQVAGVDPIVG